MKLLTDPITGSQDPRSISACLREPLRYLEFRNTVTAVSPNPYTHWKIAAPNYVIQAGDRLRYWVWVDPMNPKPTDQVTGGIEAQLLSAPTWFSVAGIVDQEGRAAWAGVDHNQGGWFERVLDLSSIAGNTITIFLLHNNANAIGEHVARYRDIRITDAVGTTLRTVIWSSGEPAFNEDFFSAASNAAQSVTYFDSPGALGDPAHASLAFTTNGSEFRDGVWHEGTIEDKNGVKSGATLSVFPAPKDRAGEDDGTIQAGENFRVDIAVTVKELSPALEFRHNLRASVNSHIYRNLVAINHVVAAGQSLVYEVWPDGKNTDGNAGGIELVFSGSPSVGRDFPLLDTLGMHLVFGLTLTLAQWNTRTIVLSPIVGRTLQKIQLTNESNGGNFRALYRNIRIVDAGGATVFQVWPTVNPILNTDEFNSFATDVAINVIEAPLSTDTSFDNFNQIVASPKAMIGRTFDLTLSSVVHEAGLPVREITDSRRARCVKASLEGNVIRMEMADIEAVAFSRLHPSATYTVADHPELFEAHVGLPITDGVGQLVRVPMVWIKKTGGTWKYAVCQKRAGLTYTVQTVYRGETEGEVGRIVPNTEYTIGNTVGAVSGIDVVDVRFTREQLNANGQPYALSADVLINAGAGVTEARLVTNEIKRLLLANGLTVDTASFDAAATVAVANEMFCDAGYVKPRTIKAILQDLLFIARGILVKGAGGRLKLVQDVAGGASATFMEAADGARLGTVEYADSPAKVSLFYRPSKSGTEDWQATPLTRSPNGGRPEVIHQNPYIRSHTTADRLVDFLAKRASVGVTTDVSINAVQVAPFELIAIEGATAYRGTKTWRALDIARPADRNDITLRLYDASIYTYTAGTLPAGATNVYTPDYSQTPPVAPTGGVVVTNVAESDATGKAFAKILVRAVPPTFNWSRLWAVVINTVTNAITAEHELLLSAGNYETTIGNLTPSHTHTVQFFATNSSDVKGAVQSVGFTAATYAGAPPTPIQPPLTQLTGLSIEAVVNAPTYSHHARVEWQRKTGAGGTYATVQGENSARLVDTTGLAYGTAYYYRARNVDLSGNVGAWATENFITPVANIADVHISPLGVGNPSMATAAVSQGKISVTSISGSLSMAPGDILDLCQNSGGYSLVPYVSEGIDIRGHYSALPSAGSLSAHNDTGSTLTVAYSSKTVNI